MISHRLSSNHWTLRVRVSNQSWNFIQSLNLLVYLWYGGVWLIMDNCPIIEMVFNYASIRSLLLGAPFLYVFSILVALSLLITYALSFSLFGGDWGSAISSLTTFPTQTSGMVIGLWQGDEHVCSVVREGVVIHVYLKEWGSGSQVYNKDHFVTSQKTFANHL